MSYLLYLRRSFTRSPRRHAVLLAVLSCAFLLPLLICIYRDSTAWGTRQFLLTRSAGETYHIGNATETELPYFEGISGLPALVQLRIRPRDIRRPILYFGAAGFAACQCAGHPAVGIGAALRLSKPSEALFRRCWSSPRLRSRAQADMHYLCRGACGGISARGAVRSAALHNIAEGAVHSLS